MVKKCVDVIFISIKNKLFYFNQHAQSANKKNDKYHEKPHFKFIFI